MTDKTKIQTYRLCKEHADGRVLESITGTSDEAMDRARRLAKDLGHTVNVWCPDYGRSGSLNIFPTDLDRRG